MMHQINNFQILSTGMEHLNNLRIIHQFEKRLQIHLRRQRINNRAFMLRPDLYQTQLGIISFFAQKLQVNGYKRLDSQTPAKSFQVAVVFNQLNQLYHTLFSKEVSLTAIT